MGKIHVMYTPAAVQPNKKKGIAGGTVLEQHENRSVVLEGYENKDLISCSKDQTIL